MTQLFDSYFPDVPVLLTFGNNDTKYHYQPAFGVNRDPYYDFIFQTWFTEHPGNATLKNLDQIELTLKQGGWYRVDLSPTLALLSLNTLIINRKIENAAYNESLATK